MINILYIHQSAELYGSDKVLLNIVEGLDKEKFYPIILLAEDGPLKKKLERKGLETHVAKVFKISRDLYKFSTFIQLPKIIYQSIKSINEIIGDIEVDLVHSNTLAVLGGAIWAKKNNIPHVWHIHEIIRHPYFAKTGFPYLINFLSDHIINNSKATQSWLVNEKRNISLRSSVIWNGIDGIPKSNQDDIKTYRRSLGLTDIDILITLVGRINSWKGHILLIEAAEKIKQSGYKNFKLLFVGSFIRNKQNLQKKLMDRIDESSIRNQVICKDFTENINLIWNSTDIAVVPSTEPEPFGMVAIEAMAAEKPVVAAAHGGLLDIVIHEETGMLFKPADSEDLSKSIQFLLIHPDTCKIMGKSGRKRQESLFTTRILVEKLSSLYSSIIER